MKGFILNQLISYLEKTYDELSVENLLNTIGTPVGGVYSPMVDYPDTTLRDLVERTSLLIDIPQKKLTRLIGVWNFSELLSTNLSWIEESSNTFELLKNHDEYLNKFVELSFPGFVAPTFRCVEISPDMLEANFSSTFLLADIAEGIIDAMILLKKERISVEAIKTAACDECSRQFILRRMPARIN
jgi:hypothetical protein